MEEHELYQDFDLKDYSSILYSLKYYYHKSGKDKETRRPIEDWLYKAKELFGYQ